MKRSLLSGLLLSQIGLFAIEPARYEFKVLATSKTSTMEKEMNNAAEAGYAFQGVMGGETAFGGKEVVVIMGRTAGQKPKRINSSPPIRHPRSRRKCRTLPMRATSTRDKQFSNRRSVAAKSA